MFVPNGGQYCPTLSQRGFIRSSVLLRLLSGDGRNEDKTTDEDEPSCHLPPPVDGGRRDDKQIAHCSACFIACQPNRTPQTSLVGARLALRGRPGARLANRSRADHGCQRSCYRPVPWPVTRREGSHRIDCG